MLRRFTLPSLILAVCFFSCSAVAQSALSQNSGVNSADTWVTLDLTTQTQNATMTLASPVYNPATGTTSNVISPTPSPITYHVEAGYDANGGLVMNLWPNGNSLAPSTTGTSVIRLAGGQVTVFDQNSNPLSESLPSGVSSSENLLTSLLGSNPAPALLSSLVIPTSGIRTRAMTLNAPLALSSDSTSASLAVPISTGVSAAWSYALSGSYYIANQVSIPVSKPNFTATRTMRFANVNWSQNSAKDNARIATGSTLRPLSSVAISSLTTLPAVPADPAAVASASTISNTGCRTIAPNLGGSQNIALVHGLFSNSCDWMRMANWINQDFRFNNEIIPTIGTYPSISPQASFSYIDQKGGAGTGQAEELMYDINKYIGKNYILVGHSQGGLVSRYAAQQFHINPGIIEGVITVDTPNLGANVTSNLSNGLFPVYNSFAQQINCDISMICLLGQLLFDVGVNNLGAFMESNDQSWVQLEPNSTFLNNLNAPTQPENFKQAGIVDLTDQRWAFVRTAATEVWNCNPEDGSCGERAVVNDVEIAYDVMEAIDDVSSMWCFDLCNWGAPFASDTALLDSIDSEYNNLIDFPDDTTSTSETTSTGVTTPAGTIYKGQSDAIVQASSQFYPNANAHNYVIPHADSHIAALRSDRVHPQLYNALKAFGEKTQASCTFAIPFQVSFSGSAVSNSFGLTTQGGCLWSAVSQATWIKVTPITNGTSSGTIDFTVAANPSNIPRWSSINVGNGSSIQSFSIYQGGPCVYSLWPGPDVAIQKTGGSGAVYVGTYMNCPWSAVSTTGWITIFSGASGTGSGSFTWTAAPNLTNLPRSGFITVANQILTVLDGSGAGTPGYGTVTINGSPQMQYYDPCGDCGAEAPMTENGTVTVTINGQAFTASYYYPMTAQQIASTLASYMNFGTSPFSASASGATITIQAAVTGVATNFPLSTSSTFDPGCEGPSGYACFTTPAFTAMASGSQLTGGTD